MSQAAWLRIRRFRRFPPTAIVDQLFTTLVAHQQGGLDHSALLTVIESLSNHQL